MSTDFDDWETDPDYVRNMGEMDQRWGGNARTAGSINMNQLIDEVRRDHNNMRERFQHPSQRDHSDGFGGKFGVQHDRKDQSALDYDYHEKLSKHSSQEISRKVITISKGDLVDDGKDTVGDAKKTFLERTQKTFSDSRLPPVAPKPDFGDRFQSKTAGFAETSPKRWTATSPTNLDSRSPRIEESTSSRRVIHEEKSSSSSSSGRELPQAFKSIQDKIDAFKKEFEEIENRVAKKSDLSKVIKKTANVETNTSNLQYVTRSDVANGSRASPSNLRPTSPLSRRDDPPKADIKSLSKKFETLGRDDGEEFKRKTEAKRKEFFDQIKHQVRETRKGLDGFDPIDDDMDDARYATRRVDNGRTTQSSPSNFNPTPSRSPSSRPSSNLSQNSQGLRPKVYTRSEITREEVVSKLVKENDKIVENETKRNIERSSSCHGSSDDDETTVKAFSEQPDPFYVQKAAESVRDPKAQERLEALKSKIIVEPEIKGAGLMARTLFDYSAVEEDELTFDVDDLITNIEKLDPGWYKGAITKGGVKKVGLFPANHVKLLNDTSEY